MRFAVTLICASIALCQQVSAGTSSLQAIKNLLNSRSSGSPIVYRQAIEQVAREAAEGKTLQQYVMAIVSRDVFAPKEVKISEETRNKYFSESREKIRSLAEIKGNGFAWYLLSLEKNDYKLLKRAAEAKNVQALNAWGTLLLTEALAGNSIGTNNIEEVMSKCFICFKEAALQGDSNGLYNMGMCYMNGYGCKLDQDLALNAFRTAAEKGHPEALNNIGGFYRDGKIVRRNFETAAQFFEKSAALGNAYGQLNFALALLRGEGVAKDERRAVELLRESANQSNAEAMNALGMCYFVGTVYEKDYTMAMKFYRMSASLGFAPAMENIAACYEYGRGCSKSKEQSVVWRVRAQAARGDRNALVWLEKNGHSAL